MTDTSTTKNAKAPTHTAYHVHEYESRGEKKSTWTRIGSAWAHSDGKGFNLQIECVPLDGRITLRVPDDKKD